jgi:transcriptional repressor NrdR
MVIKKGGQRESFDRYKVLSGLKKACEKRPISVMDMEDVVKGIEAKLLESGDKEVLSTVIGEMVIEQLHRLDQVAYVRFASVYREFSDIGEFMEALRTLVSQRTSEPGSGPGQVVPLHQNPRPRPGSIKTLRSDNLPLGNDPDDNPSE